MQTVFFEVESGLNETVVLAKIPAEGNDSALIAVFEKYASAKRLAEVLNWAAKQSTAAGET